MKIPLKYGLLITLGVIAWVLITRSLVTNPQSIVHTLGGPVFFNVLQFAMIYLGLKALEHQRGDRPTAASVRVQPERQGDDSCGVANDGDERRTDEDREVTLAQQARGAPHARGREGTADMCMWTSRAPSGSLPRLVLAR